MPLRDTMRTTEKSVKEGRTMHIGISNFDANLIEDAWSYLWRSGLFSNWISYSLVDRRANGGLLGYCRKEWMSIMAHGPLVRGKVFRGKH